MDVGPVDLLIVEFPGNQFKGEIAPALRDLVTDGTVRVLDLLFVYKDADGEVGSVELAGLGPDLEPAFADLDGQLGGGLLDAEDVAQVGADLKPNSSAALIVWENTWAARFVTAMRNAGAKRRRPGTHPGRGRGRRPGCRCGGRELSAMGLLGMAARTAVVAGTATHVAGNVQRRQQRRWAEKDAAQQPPQQYEEQQPPPQQQYAAPRRLHRHRHRRRPHRPAGATWWRS